MDRNNPVWREYLKAIIRIQIDAGSPASSSTRPTCRSSRPGTAGASARLHEAVPRIPPRAAGRPAAEGARGTDLGTFHYGSWLLERGYTSRRTGDDPLYWDYIRSSGRTIVKYFAELSDYIKSTGARRAATCSCRQLLLLHASLLRLRAEGGRAHHGDGQHELPPALVVPVRRGFAQDKPVIVVENPYGGVPPELLPKLKDGKAYDLFG